MRTVMLSIRVTTAAAAVAALLAGTAMTAASSASAAAASPTGGPGRWSQVTPNGAEISRTLAWPEAAAVSSM